MSDGFKAGVCAGVVGTMVAVCLSMLLILSWVVVDEPDYEATLTLCNSTGLDLNLTVFVLNGGGWDEISVSISNNSSIPLAITWHSQSSVDIHIVYDDFEGNERVMRYHIRNGENQVVLLI